MSNLNKWWRIVQRASADDVLRRELAWLRAKYCDDQEALSSLVARDPGLPARMMGYEHELRIRGFDLSNERDRRDGYAWAFDVHVERLDAVIDVKTQG